MTILPLLCLALATRQDAPILQSTFAGGEDGWTVVQIAGTGAKATAVHDAEHLKVGTGSLKVDYTVGPNQMAAAVLPIAEGAAAKMASIHFWVRPDANAPLLLTLVEKGGAEYNCPFTAAKGKWQEVALSSSDFLLNVDAGRPADPDGKLDMDQINAVSLVDMEQFLGQNATVAGILGVQPGARALYLSDFQLSAKPLPAAESASLIDGFARPQPNWAVVNATASLVNEAPLNARALRLDYNLVSGKAAGAFHRLRLGQLVGKRTIDFRVAAASACHLLVQLEEKSGGKYNATVEVPGGSAAVDRSVDLSEMAAAEDSKDDNGKLDLDQVKQMTILDITALIDAPGRNTLWIGPVSAHG
jgi:hypothetical protein